MNENCWYCIGPQLQHPFSFCGSELVQSVPVGRLVRSVSIALQISLISHNSLHLELLCPLKCYEVLWTLLTLHRFWLLLTPVTLSFDGWPLPSISSCALGPWGSHTCGNPSRTDWSIQTLHSQPWYDHWSKPILNLLRAIISIVMA
jgi:hypothetical protein